MDESITIPCASIFFFVILFGFILALRYLSYRETLALAEKGLVRPDRARGDNKGALRWGILIPALGAALCLGLWPLGFAFGGSRGGFPLGFGPWMLLGLVPTFFGLALILIYVLTREAKKPEEKEPPRSESGPVSGGE
jgi:hypothetical protein